MRKKLLATVLAANMVLSMAPVLPASTGTVASAEEAATDVATDVIDTVGTKDLSSAFFTQFSKHYLLTQNCDATFTFRNYSNCVNNWENYVMAFTNEAGINNLDKSRSFCICGRLI